MPARAEPCLPLVGAATGIVTAATGVYVIPAVPYLQALGLDKDELVQACGPSFTVSTVALAAVLAHDGVLDTAVAGASLLALAGMALGQWVRCAGAPRVVPPVLPYRIAGAGRASRFCAGCCEADYARWGLPIAKLFVLRTGRLTILPCFCT